MVNVVKRGGKKQKFSAEKLRNSLRKAVIDAGFSVADKKKLIDKVSKETISWAKEEGDVKTTVILVPIIYDEHLFALHFVSNGVKG
jgi:transcriptional regulator NrdR family protein